MRRFITIDLLLLVALHYCLIIFCDKILTFLLFLLRKKSRMGNIFKYFENRFLAVVHFVFQNTLSTTIHKM
jgi:hypothetical protein